MDLSDLHIFRTVVQEGTITKAADKLCRVQSNVTTRIKQLEADLETPLFIREGKRLALAPAGRTLLDYANRLLSLAEEARTAVQGTHPRGLFKLGSMESTAAVQLPDPLSQYHKRFPDVILELQTNNPQVLSARVMAGELDAALVAEPIADAPFEKMPTFEEDVVIVTKAGHPPIDGSRPAPPTVLVLEQGCPQRRRLEDWYAARGEMPERTIEMSSYHGILSCVAIGMGVALVPESIVPTFPEHRRLGVHPMPDGMGTRKTVLIWKREGDSPNIKALRDVLAKAP